MEGRQLPQFVFSVEKDQRSDNTGFYTVYASNSETCDYVEALATS